jgi:predicted TIM-barrel fold metal-dependent hydrolase
MSRDDLVKKANAGLPLSGVAVLDFHAHMGPYYNFHIPYNDAAGMIASMDALGIDTTLVCPHIAIGPDFRQGNDMALKACLDFPGRFLGAIGINPNYPEMIVPEFERFKDHAEMKAVKLHPSLHEYEAGGESYRVVYREAAGRGLPVETHTWCGDGRCAPKVYEKIAAEFTETNFVLVHSGGVNKGIGEAIQVAECRENVYLETSGSMTFDIVGQIVDRIGSRRLLFGSDNPFIDPAAQVGKVIYAPISRGAKLDVLGRNSRRLLGLR